MEPIRTLIVDDERSICEACRSVLSKRGHIVDVRMTGQAGLDAILGGGYEITLLDMKLPDLDGMEILRTVQKEKPGEHIVVMTGSEVLRGYHLSNEAKAAIVSGDLRWINENVGELTQKQLMFIYKRLEREAW